MSLLVKGDILGGIWRGLRPAVDVNQRVDALAIQQLVSRDVANDDPRDAGFTGILDEFSIGSDDFFGFLAVLPVFPAGRR